MGMTERIWDTLTTVLRMNDRVVALSDTIAGQQRKIETLTERVIRLEAVLELTLRPNLVNKLEQDNDI